jgi:RNA polymerase sigma factor (sigma-70 family)
MSPKSASHRTTDSQTSTSRSLLAALRDQEPAAWERLVSLYAPLVYYWCRTMGLAEQDMPDIFQDVFQAVARKIADFQKDCPADTFRGWLRTITTNKVRDHFRRESRRPHAAGGTTAQLRLAEFPAAPEGSELSERATGHVGESLRDSQRRPGGTRPRGATSPSSRHAPRAVTQTAHGSVPTPVTGQDDTGSNSEDGLLAEDQPFRELFRRALQQIAGHFEVQTWQAFWRVVVEGKTAQEVARELSMQPGTVRVAKSRVLHRLRKELGELPE